MPCSIYLSAAHKSSGKTIVSLGLSAAFRQKSASVQCFKKGPDYIDAIWLAKASGAPCYNLDFYNMKNAEIKNLYQKHASKSDVALIEGNKGLFDGLSISGGDANADLAKLLNIAVILVLDASGITRGIAPLVNGYLGFDSKVNIAGVILNKVASERHQSKLVGALEYYTDIAILGAVRREKTLQIDERYLGLMPATEMPQYQQIITQIGTQIADQVDLKQIAAISDDAAISDNPVAADEAISDITIINDKPAITIAVARDSAFGFYYADDLQALARDCKLIYFDTLKDKALPPADGLFIGGGFPETQAASLADNQSLMADIKSKITAGLPTYAECGGLMYLSKKIMIDKQNYPMVGIIDADIMMSKKPIGRGYVQLKANKNHPWNGVSSLIYAHEFHYSKLVNIAPNMRYAYQVLRGVGINNKQDGLLIYNLLACYAHLRSTAGNQWVAQFIDFVKGIKEAI